MGVDSEHMSLRANAATATDGARDVAVTADDTMGVSNQKTAAKKKKKKQKDINLDGKIKKRKRRDRDNRESKIVISKPSTKRQGPRERLDEKKKKKKNKSGKVKKRRGSDEVEIELDSMWEKPDPRGRSQDRPKDKEKVRISDIDARIKELEAEIKGEQDRIGARHDGELNSLKDEEGDHAEEEDLGELERIPSLPPSMLPGYSSAQSNPDTSRKNKKKKKNSSPNVRCDICGLDFYGSGAYEEHRRTSEHRRSVLAKMGGAYEPAMKRSCYCRACRESFSSTPELLDHRETEEHRIMAKLEREASFCPLCNKQFTSPNQLEEHAKGKWHQMRASQRRGAW